MKFESLIEQKSEEMLREMLARYDRGERCFVGLDLAGVEMRGTNPRSSGCWVGADFCGANFQGARLGAPSFKGIWWGQICRAQTSRVPTFVRPISKAPI